MIAIHGGSDEPQSTGDQLDRCAIDNTVHERWQQLGHTELLLPEEQDYLHIWWLSVEVNNGGFHQYFWNSAGDTAVETVAALKRMEATQTRGMLERALDLLEPLGGFTADREARQERMKRLPEDSLLFDPLSDEFFASTEDLDGKAMRRVADAYKRNGISPIAR